MAPFVLYFQPKPISIPSDFVNFILLAVVAFQAYRQIAGDRTVEDWVKAHYLLIIAGNVLLCASAVDTINSIITTGTAGAFAPITNIALILGVVLFYLAWMMPEAFRSFLNCNYKQAVVVQSLSEEEILKQLGELSA